MGRLTRLARKVPATKYFADFEFVSDIFVVMMNTINEV